MSRFTASFCNKSLIIFYCAIDRLWQETGSLLNISIAFLQKKIMMNNFQIKALAYNQFANLFLASDDDLKDIGALKMIVNEHPGFP